MIMSNEQKVIVACSSCATQYNVATLTPGARFKCRQCGTVNAVPAPTPQIAPTAWPQLKPAVNMPARQVGGQGASPRLTAPTKPMVKSIGIKPSGLRKGLPSRIVTIQAGVEEGMEGLVVKKKSKSPLFIGIMIGAVILVVVIIVLSGNGGLSEEEAMLKKIDAERVEREKALAEEEAKKIEDDKKTAEENPVEEKPTPEIRKIAPESKKAAKPKFKDEIDQRIKTEIEPVLNDIKNQRDIEPSVERIMSYGKKAIPILIEAVGGEDDDAARYAYEILLKLTKRKKDDTTQVNQMLGRSMRQECQKDWEVWWYKHKDGLLE
jgi:hypothetical protein